MFYAAKHGNKQQHAATHWDLVLIADPIIPCSTLFRVGPTLHPESRYLPFCKSRAFQWAAGCNTLHHTATYSKTLQHNWTWTKSRIPMLAISLIQSFCVTSDVWGPCPRWRVRGHVKWAWRESTTIVTWTYECSRSKDQESSVLKRVVGYKLQGEICIGVVEKQDILQHTATHCVNTLQHVATYCDTLRGDDCIEIQYTATRCKVQGNDCIDIVLQTRTSVTETTRVRSIILCSCGKSNIFYFNLRVFIKL